MKRWLVALAVLSTVAALSGPVAPHIGSGSQGPEATAAESVAKLPMAFEPNIGQADSRTRFLSHGNGSMVSLTSTGMVLSMAAPDAMPAIDAPHTSSSMLAAQLGLIEMDFRGANPDPRVVGTDRLPGVSNYLVGNDPSQWRTGVPQYERVTYRGLYPGIGLTFYGNQQGRLEYDLAVAPGVDPSIIRLSILGPETMALDPTGDLVLRVGGRDVVQPRPSIYQDLGGARHDVAGGYVLNGHEVGFSIGVYNRTRPLVIDPQIVYSTYLGGSGDDLGEVHPAADSSGHVYICGDTDSVDFPVSSGVLQPSLAGGFDAFVTKLTPDGTGIVYSTYLGGTGDFDAGVACAVDAGGSLYMDGVTNSTDFPTTAGAFQRTFKGGGADGYAAKLSSDGAHLLYSTYIGGSNFDELVSLQVDSSGDVFASGDTSSTDFPTTPGAYQTSNAGGHGLFCSPACDAVVLKLDPTGSGLIYSTYLGGPGDDGLQPDLAIDAAGNAYVEGTAFESRFPTTPGAFQTHFGGGTDAFLTKLDPTGAALVYSTYLGGGGEEVPFGIAVDGSGNAYLAGFTCSRNFPVTPGAFQTSNAGGLVNPRNEGCIRLPGHPVDAFVTKLNPEGSGLVFSTYLGGHGGDLIGNDPIVDSSGHVIVTGVTNSTDFPITADALQPTNHGGGFFDDGFITELTADGSGLIFSSYWGGSGQDGINGSVLDSSGNLYITGCTASTDFPVTPGAFQTTLQGGSGLGFFIGCAPSDAFATKIAFGS
jgi:hypothetical protein